MTILAAAPGGEDHGHGGPKHTHGNPEDLDRYISLMESEDRAEWQKPEEVVRALGLRAGDSVCDIGAGPGYFTIRLARAVGPAGRVFAVDVEPKILAVLRDRLERAGLSNVTPVLSRAGDPYLPADACDLILIVDTFHHFPDGAAYLRALASRLKPDGRIVNIDFHKRDLPVGPPVGHKVAREDFVKVARTAGLAVVEEQEFLPYQYFLVLRPEVKR